MLDQHLFLFSLHNSPLLNGEVEVICALVQSVHVVTIIIESTTFQQWNNQIHLFTARLWVAIASHGLPTCLWHCLRKATHSQTLTLPLHMAKQHQSNFCSVSPRIIAHTKCDKAVVNSSMKEPLHIPDQYG